jgi:antitoxin ParD1/3/4
MQIGITDNYALQVDKKEYSSKSELVNDLIRQARKQQAQVDQNREG